MFNKYKDFASSRNSQGVSVQFRNETERNVFLIWINFDGDIQVYSVLAPRQRVNIMSFHDHRWISLDAKTAQELMLNNTTPCTLNASSVNAGSMFIVNITIPIFSLQDLALSRIVSSLHPRTDLMVLKLPNKLRKSIKDRLLSIPASL